MFCCTRFPAHSGEIVTSICLEEECIQSQAQLCCAQCVQQQHSNHNSSTMKNMLPSLLSAHNQKNSYLKIIKELLNFFQEELEDDQLILQNFGGVDRLNIFNIVDAVKITIMEMRKKSQEQNKKIKQIEKTLHMKPSPNTKSQLAPNNSFKINAPLSSGLQEFRNLSSLPMATSKHHGANIDSFSQTIKHPYITVSSDSHSAHKNSHASGYKLAILSTAPFPLSQQSDAYQVQVRVKIVKSQGNVMIGLGIPQIISEKQYINCYGSGQGSILLGQNNNDPGSAILFHHSDPIYNRKQIVAWNYKEGDVLGVAICKKQGNYFVIFKKYSTKESGKTDFNKVENEFMMPLFSNKELNKTGNFHLLALLQSIGDEVQIIPDQE